MEKEMCEEIKETRDAGNTNDAMKVTTSNIDEIIDSDITANNEEIFEIQKSPVQKTRI